MDRARFDALLLNAASAMPGVRLYQPAKITYRHYADGIWSIRLDTGETVHANYIADAAGRARILEGPKRALGVPTMAMYCYWKGVTDCEEGDTLVEAGRAAWYWGAPLPGGEFAAAVFVDPGRGSNYFELLHRSGLLAPRLRAATPCSPVRICDATAFEDLAPVTNTFIKVGDAALSLDPLSSQGVQTAIGTAMHAAVVLNTLIEKPEDTSLAMEFFRSRLDETARFHSAAASDFYSQHFAAKGGDYWKKRALFPRRSIGAERPTAASAPNSLVHLSSDIVFTSVAIVDGVHVSRQPGVKLRSRVFAFALDGIAVAPLLKDIDRPVPAMEVIRRWSRSIPVAKAIQLFDWAIKTGLVEISSYANSVST